MQSPPERQLPLALQGLLSCFFAATSMQVACLGSWQHRANLKSLTDWSAGLGIDGSESARTASAAEHDNHPPQSAAAGEVCCRACSRCHLACTKGRPHSLPRISSRYHYLHPFRFSCISQAWKPSILSHSSQFLHACVMQPCMLRVQI